MLPNVPMNDAEKLAQIAFDGAAYITGALAYYYPVFCKLQIAVVHIAHAFGYIVNTPVG